VTAVDAGLRALVGPEHDASAKIFRPLDPTRPLGTLAQEMDVLRYCVGAWPRTRLPYEAAEVRLVDFLAFAYAAERACRVAGETKAAKVFAFIRCVPDVDLTSGYDRARLEKCDLRGAALPPNHAFAGSLRNASDHPVEGWVVNARGKLQKQKSA